MRETEIDRIGGTRFFECYYRGRLSYGVEQVSTGCKAVFNHNKRVLAAVKSVVSNRGNIARAYDNSLHIYHKGKKLFSLALFLFCLYNDIDPYNADLSNNVRHIRKRKHKKIEDCRADNLYLGGVSVELDEEHKAVIVSSNTRNYRDEFDPIPLLVDIMNTTNFVMYFGNGNRLMCHIKGCFGFPVADLAYLAYHDKLTMENYIEKLAELKRYKKDNGLNIEHLEGLFYERFFCEAIANTADEHFIDLDKHITPTEAAEGV